ncbi:MAG: type IV secretory system conjugative DNA transfer family protein [Lachnospiraceae bacterium]|nr:type IV secretory system conjugative DNA transfer family protein [Lachnospiraceae bacterium]
MALKLANNQQIARSLIRQSTKDPFWSDSAADALCGLIFLLLEYGRRDQVNFANIFYLLNTGERQQMIGESVKSSLRWVVDAQPPDSLISMNLLSYVTTANDTRGGIRSELLRMISMFTVSKGVIGQTSQDDLHIRDIDGTEKIAVYVTLPDESDVYDGLAGLLMNDLIVHYEEIAHRLYNGRLPIRVNFILEELANIGGAIPTLPQLLAAGRSRNIRVHYVLQSLDQLNDVYRERAQSVINNTDITVLFRTNHIETLETMSHLCGDREVVYADRVMREPLFKITDLAALPTGRALIRISGQVQYTEDFPFYEEEKTQEKDPAMLFKRIRRIAEPIDIRPIARELGREKTKKSEEVWKRPTFEEYMRSRVTDHTYGEEEENDDKEKDKK